MPMSNYAFLASTETGQDHRNTEALHNVALAQCGGGNGKRIKFQLSLPFQILFFFP